MSTHFYSFLLKFGITHAPRTKWPPWTNGQVEIQNKHLSSYFRFYLCEAGNNWAKLVCQFASAQKTSVNSSTGTTLYENVFGFEPQIPISLKLGRVQNDNDLCQSEFCQSLPNHTEVNKGTSRSCTDHFLSSKRSMDLVNHETLFKNIYRKVYRKIREANHRALSFRNKYKLPKLLRVGQKVLLDSHNFSVRKNSKTVRTRKWTVHSE